MNSIGAKTARPAGPRRGSAQGAGGEKPGGKTTRAPRRSSGDGYHHGALRASLLDAAEQVLREGGLEALSLRECARRVGVSHAAPAHHFGDARGLLSAFAAVGFERLAASMERYAEGAADAPWDRLRAVGRAYIDFALAHPQHFRLMFRRDLLDSEQDDLAAAGRRAAGALREALRATGGNAGAAGGDDATRAILAWSAVHGFATLALEQQLGGDFGIARGDRAALAQAGDRMLGLLGPALAGRAPPSRSRG